MRRLRDLLDPVGGARRERSVLSGMILLGLAGLAVYCGVTRHIPLLGGESGTVIQAEFAQANFVDNQTPVRVGGVDVGHVTDVQLEPGRNLARVTLRLTNPQVVVKRDALAAVRWRTLLGGTFYIDLDPGSPSATPLGDQVIPVAHTSYQVEFDDLDQVFAGGTANGPRVFLREFDHALAGPSPLGSALTALRTTTPTIAAGLAAFRGQDSDDLRRLVSATAATVDTLGRDTASLQGLITGMQGTFAVTDSERQALGRLIDLGPGALDSTSATMSRLQVTLGHLDPLVAALRPGAVRLGPATAAAAPALSALQVLLGHTRPLLGPLAVAFTSLAQASRSGVPLMQGLMPTLGRMRGNIDPWLAQRDPSTGMRTYEALGPTFAAIDGGASELDGEGFWLHFPTQSDTRSLVLGLPGGDGTAPMGRLCAAPKVSQSRCQSLVAALDQVFAGGSRR